MWRILKKHPKWDAPKPLDADDHTEIFGPRVRPRPVGKPRPAKKTKSETTENSGGSQSGFISESLYEDLRRKLQAVESAYEVKKEKELAYMKCKELEFLMIDAGFNREISWPLGQISLLVSLGDKEHSTSALDEFHGVVTLQSSRVAPIECRMVIESLTRPDPKTPAAKGIKMAIHPEYPDQTFTIGISLTEKGRMELCDLLRSNLDVEEKRPSPDINKDINEEVSKLVEADIMREVHRQVPKKPQQKLTSITSPWPFYKWGIDISDLEIRMPSLRPGDFVYQYNEASHAEDTRKLGLKWERPYEVVEALGKGAYKLRNGSGDILPRTWNV
ncbi:hypothetical protein Tco_1301350 [Tanacetum coccineum]